MGLDDAPIDWPPIEHTRATLVAVAATNSPAPVADSLSISQGHAPISAPVPSSATTAGMGSAASAAASAAAAAAAAAGVNISQPPLLPPNSPPSSLPSSLGCYAPSEHELPGPTPARTRELAHPTLLPPAPDDREPSSWHRSDPEEQAQQLHPVRHPRKTLEPLPPQHTLEHAPLAAVQPPHQLPPHTHPIIASPVPRRVVPVTPLLTSKNMLQQLPDAAATELSSLLPSADTDTSPLIVDPILFPSKAVSSQSPAFNLQTQLPPTVASHRRNSAAPDVEAGVSTRPPSTRQQQMHDHSMSTADASKKRFATIPLSPQRPMGPVSIAGMSPRHDSDVPQQSYVPSVRPSPSSSRQSAEGREGVQFFRRDSSHMPNGARGDTGSGSQTRPAQHSFPHANPCGPRTEPNALSRSSDTHERDAARPSTSTVNNDNSREEARPSRDSNAEAEFTAFFGTGEPASQQPRSRGRSGGRGGNRGSFIPVSSMYMFGLGSRPSRAPFFRGRRGMVFRDPLEHQGFVGRPPPPHLDDFRSPLGGPGPSGRVVDLKNVSQRPLHPSGGLVLGSRCSHTRPSSSSHTVFVNCRYIDDSELLLREPVATPIEPESTLHELWLRVSLCSVQARFIQSSGLSPSGSIEVHDLSGTCDRVLDLSNRVCEAGRHRDVFVFIVVQFGNARSIGPPPSLRCRPLPGVLGEAVPPHSPVHFVGRSGASTMMPGIRLNGMHGEVNAVAVGAAAAAGVIAADDMLNSSRVNGRMSVVGRGRLDFVDRRMMGPPFGGPPIMAEAVYSGEMRESLDGELGRRHSSFGMRRSMDDGAGVAFSRTMGLPFHSGSPRRVFRCATTYTPQSMPRHVHGPSWLGMRRHAAPAEAYHTCVSGVPADFADQTIYESRGSHVFRPMWTRPLRFGLSR